MCACYAKLLEAVLSLVGSIYGEANVSSCADQSKQYKLQEEPPPTSSARARPGLETLGVLVVFVLTKVLLRLLLRHTRSAVQISGFDLDQIEVVRELASLGGKPEVADRRKLDVLDLEAVDPFVLLLVLKVDSQRLFRKVGDLGLCGNIGIAEATCLVMLVATRGPQGCVPY